MMRQDVDDTGCTGEDGRTGYMTPQEIELSETLSELLQAGKEPEQGLLDRVVAFGPATVPALIEMATDETLHQADSESPEVWAPLHAANLLGHLQAAEAVEPLLPLLQMDDDWLAEALPEVYGKIGEPALEPLRAYLFDRTQGVWGRVTAARALKQIGSTILRHVPAWWMLWPRASPLSTRRSPTMRSSTASSSATWWI